MIAGNEAFFAMLGLEGCGIVPGEDLSWLPGWLGTLAERELPIDLGSVTFSSNEYFFRIKTPGPDGATMEVFSALLPAGNAAGRIWIIRDTAAHRAVEEQLRHSQKMEAVGRLAGGIAHDFNNLLTGILGNLSLIELDLPDSPPFPWRDNLRNAIKAGERAAELVRQLLGFSRRNDLVIEPCDVSAVLVEVRDMLAAGFAPSITMKLDLGEEACPVAADVNLLSQVILNMAFNARDAMPDGGELVFAARRVLARERVENEQIPGEPACHACISVVDSGTGIAAEVLPRIFEPFFTTKEPGKGTGLGLATSFGIVRQLGGWIEVRSELGKGTRFDIFLPCTAPLEAVRTDSPALPTRERASEGPGAMVPATILIVDDDDLVRKVSATFCAKLGYQVETAGDGNECLEKVTAAEGGIDLVLLDLTMPNMPGQETFLHLRDLRPELPVIICSGDLLEPENFPSIGRQPPEAFLQKPYRLEDLASVVAKILAMNRRRM